MIKFEILNREGGARTGLITTQHGVVHTPTVTVNFTPAFLRTGITPAQVKGLGAELLLVNTLHAYLGKISDVHEFLKWDGPVIADSGGYQMISLAKKLRTMSDGVEFTIDEQTVTMTPEKVLEIQRSIGIDMMMPLDYVVDVRRHNIFTFVDAVLKTERWFAKAHATGHENLFYIVQGGTSSIARSLSLRFARRWLDAGVEAVALGGISLGERSAQIHETVEYCCKRLPENKPRHLLGVGRPIDLVRGVLAGVDTFDCVAITREARHGRLWTRDGQLRITRNEFERDERVIEEGCDCPACSKGVSRGVLRAGLRDDAQKLNTQVLLMFHNIRFVQRLMGEMRGAIAEGSLAAYAQKFIERYPKDSK